MTVDVVLIGTDVVAWAIAWELSHYDLRTVVLELPAHELPFLEAAVPFGIIHGGHHSKTGTLRGELEWEGNQRWDQWAQRLRLDFHRPGELVLAFGADDLFVLGDLVRQAQERDIPGIEMWTAARVRAVEPGVASNLLSALFTPVTGVIKSQAARAAFTQGALENRVRCIRQQVLALRRENGEWIIETSGGPVRAAFLINAAGVEADTIARMAGARTLGLQTRHTHDLLLEGPGAGPAQHILYPCSCFHQPGACIIPTGERRLWARAMAYEVGTGDDLGTHEVPDATIIADVQRLLPSLGDMAPKARLSQPRAVASIHDFSVGATGTAGLLNAAGLQTSGISAAPAISARLVRVLRDEGVELRPRTTFVSRRSLPEIPN